MTVDWVQVWFALRVIVFVAFVLLVVVVTVVSVIVDRGLGRIVRKRPRR